MQFVYKFLMFSNGNWNGKWTIVTINRSIDFSQNKIMMFYINLKLFSLILKKLLQYIYKEYY